MHKVEGEGTVSVKGGCLEGLDMKQAIHIWCKEAIIDVPDGIEAYDEEPPGPGRSFGLTSQAK